MVTKNQIFTEIKKAILEKYPKAYVTSERVYSPSQFPCVWVVTIDDYPELKATSLDFGDSQKRLVLEVQAFSNKTSGASAEAEKIVEIATKRFREMQFRCTTSQPVDNQADATIKRYVARYTRFIGEGDTI